MAHTLKCLGVHLVYTCTVLLNTESKCLITEPLSLFPATRFCFPGLALLSSGSSPPGAPSLCSYQHRSLSIERPFCHGGLEEKYRTKSSWMGLGHTSISEPVKAVISAHSWVTQAFFEPREGKQHGLEPINLERKGEKGTGISPKLFYVRAFLAPYIGCQLLYSKIPQNSVA